MHVRALHLARLVLTLALFPALAGCMAQESLDRADVGDAPVPRERAQIAWASLDEAIIRPGVPLQTEARECPTNFFFARSDNGAVFIGTTAYCVRDLGIGALATIGGPEHIAVLIYSSTQTMDEIAEEDANAREYNDLAIFHLDGRSRAFANPTLPGGVGPTGLADGSSFALGDRLRAFAQDANLPRDTDWRDAIVAGNAGEWALLTHGALPGTPGALGGPVVDLEGRAVGIFATLGVYPNPGSNGVTRLDMMLAYARDHARLDVEVATADDAPTASP